MTESTPSNDSTLRYITVSDIQCNNLPGRLRSYAVSVTVDQNENRTESIRAQSPAWTEQFPYAVTKTSSLTLTVWRRRMLLGDKSIGRIYINVGEILDKSVGPSQDITQELIPPRQIDGRTRLVPAATIHLKITERTAMQIVRQVVSDASNSVDHLRLAPALVQTVFGGADGADGADGAGSISYTSQEDPITWKPVLDSVKGFASLVKDISQIHPYAHAAFKVLSVVPMVINDQLKTDQQLRGLISAMKQAYEFVEKAAPLEHIKLHVDFFQKMAHATFECGNFIREYVMNESFVARAIKGIVSKGARDHIANHMQTLRSLMEQFKEDAVINTEISVVRTLEMTESIIGAVDGLTAKSYLDDMRYADGAGCVPEKRCLEGTRRHLLDSITERLHGGIAGEGQSSERILLLTGVAGSGKSAVAHEVAYYFKSLHRLGASFCFSASYQTERSVDRFFSTIARGFAEIDDGWKNALVDIIKSDKELRTTRSPRQQLEEFILKPAQKLQFFGPIIVVVDALDEVAIEDRNLLLECLSRLASDTTLPDNIRFFITSRSEPAIFNALYGRPHIHHMDIISADASDDIDIHRFIEHKLVNALSDAEDDIIRDHWVPSLVEQAEKSFQWAYTACEFIKNDSPGLSVQQRFLMLKNREYRGLESLYEAILNRIITTGNILKQEVFEGEIREKLRTVLGTLVTAYEPLPWTTWVDLLGGDSEGVRTAGSVLPYLAPLFRGVSIADRENNRPVQPAHTSLLEYLTQGGNEQFRVDTLASHVKLVNACLRTMDAQLCFNICGLETSYRANKDVPDLACRIRQNISPALMYACRFWNAHLTTGQHWQYSLDILLPFLQTKLLFWLEVMALLGMVVSASIGIKEVSKRIQASGSQKHPQLEKMLNDVDQFVSMCGAAIAFSTPHLYLSALAYVPQTSFIHRYSDVYAGGIHVFNKEDVRWPECILCTVTPSSINGVAVSPNGHILATAHDDGTIRIWNTVTGEHVGKPLLGHTGSVCSISFSPDCKTVATGSHDKTVRLWSVTTGEQIADALRGHTGSVRSVSFSPDGLTLVSGSDDKTIRRWKVASREPAGEPLVGHTGWVTSVTFSPSGKTIASGSRDRTLRVWNAETGELMYPPLEGHRGHITSVVFSTDGRTLASGAQDKAVRLWDVATGTPKGEPLVGHTGWVTSVAFSPDGRTVASGSKDLTIRLWMMDTERAVGDPLRGHSGRPVGDPLRGHSGPIYSIAFSSNKQTLVSVSSDSTIRVWKIETVEAERVVITGHTDSINAVAVSPDNRIAASGSIDGTVRLWDVGTGWPMGELLHGRTNGVTSVAFSPDGGTIASGSWDRKIRLWDVQMGQLVREFSVRRYDYVNSVAFSPDGKIVASDSHNKEIGLWSATTGEQLGESITGHANAVTSIAFSPDGHFLASGSADKMIMLWNVRTRARIGEPLCGHGDHVLSVAFSPDARIIASGSNDTTIQLWDSRTQAPIGEAIRGHGGSVTSVAFSPNGKTIVSSSSDATICVWDIGSHLLVGGPLRGHTHKINSVAFSPDGTLILSGSDDRTIRLWSVPVVDSSPLAGPLTHATSFRLSYPLENVPALSYGPSNMSATSNSPSVTAVVCGNEYPPSITAESREVTYTDSSLIDSASGYVLGPQNELLFWVPPDYRANLWRPGNRWVNGERSLHLDLSCFKHGEGWVQCVGASAG